MIFWKKLLNNLTMLKTRQSIEINSMKNMQIKNYLIDGTSITIYLSNNKNINLRDLEQLCNAVGWIKRPLKKIKVAIHNSFITISILWKQNNRVCLIGFARATSDHAFNATIWDVVIHPKFQGLGLGKMLIKEVIKDLKSAEIHKITLFADPQVIQFYTSLGFKQDPSKTKGMFWYPK